MVHPTKLQTIGGKETPGDVLTDELRADIWKNLCSTLDQAGVGPIVMWGEWAMLYYGVPISENHLHILVPDDQLEVAYDAMKASGYKDWPFEIQEDYGLLDPNVRWDELGAPARRMFGDLHNERAHFPVVLQNYASAASTFDKEMTASFEKCAGLSIPPLHILAQSFLRALFKVTRSESTSRTESILLVWVTSVKSTGYTPLGVEAMKGTPGIDEEMQKLWENGSYPAFKPSENWSRPQVLRRCISVAHFILDYEQNPDEYLTQIKSR